MNSILEKKWVIEAGDLTELQKRNLDDDGVTFHDPFAFPDMEKAVARIQDAIKGDERILIFGDYDADGVSGTAILVHALRELDASVSYRLPTRQEGYGLNMGWIEEFKKVGANLLITVDCGISSAKEIAAAQKAGIDVILTDHHAIPKKRPQAFALLHPEEGYPFPHLAGAGVAFKLAVALMGDEWIEKLVDLASLGTVADCVPLIGENRWITKHGIEQMRKTEWEGLKTLLKTAGVKEINGHNSDIIGFRLGPRINAAGRLETPYFALQMLLNENGSALSLAEKLESMNNDRKVILEKALETAENRIKKDDLFKKPALILWDTEWGAGIVGLIASRISEKYHRPTIIMENRGEDLIGSCRAPDTFNMVKALQSMPDHFESFGGHSGAAGFTLPTKNLTRFLEEMEEYTTNNISEKDLQPTLTIDYEVTLPEITFDLANQLASLEPYGEKNPRPCFVVKNIEPLDLQTVGQEHRHLKFTVQGPKHILPAIAFRFGPYYKDIQKAFYDKKPIDVAFELEKNVWNGKERLQLRVVDLRLTK